ncbi:uncharacterized protein [Choristoneura fumiferana]|uniref:uncharacterized protein n=1 Tax=Choristoneura fumiferana TaxID=7141 RepID=UPI003D156CB0
MLENTFIFVLGLTLVASRHGPFYRTDYTYIYKYDAFYKVHWDGNGLSWDQASSTCADEESSLFYPEVKDEWTVVKALVAGMKKKPNVTDIIVGMSDEFGYGEIKSVGGDLPDPTPIPIEQAPKTRTCVIMDIETGSYNMTGSCEMGSVKSFVCKKKATCPTIDTGYIYVKNLHACYKVHQSKKTWDDADKTCTLEGAALSLSTGFIRAEVLIPKLRYFEEYFLGPRIVVRSMSPQKAKSYDEQLANESFIRYECNAVHINKTEKFERIQIKNCYETSYFVCEMELNS